MRVMRGLLIYVVAIFLSPSIMAQVDEARPPDSQLPEEERILEAGDARAPGSLRVEARCSDHKRGTSLATFSWSPPSEDVLAHRVDITMFRGGFKAERFESLGRVPAAQNSLVWGGGEAGINYYWRVLALTPEGWAASATKRFEAPICPVDSVEPPQQPPR